MKPVKWGILSTSDFAERKFIPGLQKSPRIDVAAVGSRDLKRAQDFARRMNIAKAYGSYEELLRDPEIEVIYNPLPGALHAEWTAKAAKAGKHVLCEKPMGMNAKQLDVLKPLARKVHIAEGFMVRFHPQWIETRERVRTGELGKLSHIHVAFGYDNMDAKNIRNIAKAGGGALYDIGCYAIVAARWFFEGDPKRVAATQDFDPKFKTDRLTSALLDFGKGRTALFSVATQVAFHQRVHLFGSKARLEITIPFNQPQDDTTTYLIADGSSDDGLDAKRTTLPVADQYTLQGEAFSRRIREEKPSPKYLNDAIANMKVIDATFKSAKTGRFVTID
jgi:predicted dehydrogenase